MNTIHKFEVPEIEDIIEIKSYRIVRWLKLDFQNKIACIWAEVDTDSEIRTRQIFIRGTGHPMSGVEGEYIGTLQFRTLVFHYFADQK
jgi:hypothetical protein